MKSSKSDKLGFIGRTKLRLYSVAQNFPLFVKVTLYMSGPFILCFLLGYPIWGLLGDNGHLLFWPLAIYLFLGSNVAMKAISRERIIKEPFSMNIFISILIGTYIWPFLSKRK